MVLLKILTLLKLELLLNMIKDAHIIICEECKSEFFSHVSKMASLCPECSYILYGYKNCDHIFKDGRCIYCFWNGNQSEYLKKLKELRQTDL